jgi:ArsR family transcriptional regulator
MSSERGSGGVEGQDEATGTGAGGCCTPAVAHDLTEHDVEVDVETFSALANDTRYEVLRLLAAADDEVCACDLHPQLDVNQSTASRALGALYRAGLVDRRKEGRWRYYTTTLRAEKLLTAVDTTREDVA